jgi:hypothetical protein
MSHKSLMLEDHQHLVFGYDRPSLTYYAMLYDYAGGQVDVPVKTIGYHPAAQELWQGVEHGPYPASRDQVVAALHDWGMNTRTQFIVRRQLEAMGPQPAVGYP